MLNDLVSSAKCYLASCKLHYLKVKHNPNHSVFIILCHLLYVVQCSLFLTQKGLCLANYRGSCTALNQRLGVSALTKPVGKPVAKAAAVHCSSNCSENTAIS